MKNKTLKALRLKKHLTLDEVVKDFTFKRTFYWVEIDAPIHFTTLYRYEDWTRDISDEMYEALIEHINNLESK